jgi:hypothetical protein
MSALEQETYSAMSESDDRRSEILARLGTDPRQLGVERRSFPQGVAARLAAMLKEIDETVLPRVLCLTSNRGEVARLTVSHRRLIAVDLPGRPFAPRDTDTLPDLMAARLVEIAETRTDLVLTIARRASVPDHAETACSVLALTKSLETATPQNAFDRLLDQASARCQARLLWSATNAQMHFSGAEDWKVPLQTLVANFRAMGRDRQVDARVGPLRTEGVAIPVDADRVVVIAVHDKKGFAVVLPREAGLAMIAAWQSR